MRRINPLLISAPILAIGLAVLLCGCGPGTEEAPPVRPVRAMRVGDAAAIAGRVFPGRAQATREVDLSFRVSGPLVGRPVNVGDTVVIGQELATIDPRDFEVRLRTTQAQLEEARAAQRAAADNFARTEEAHGEGAVSELELVGAREAQAATVARVNQLLTAVEAEEDALDYTHLKAPYDGIVVAIYAENHEDVNAKQVVLRLLDNSRIEMVIEIPEQLISLAPRVEDLRCRFDAFPDLELPATIKEIGTEASETTRTYPVTLIMEQPEDVIILPGMAGEASGRVSTTGESTDGAFEVPTSAILSTDGSTSIVWIIDGTSKTVKRKEVVLGRTTPRGILVTGLEPGEWIATAGIHYLREGQQVRMMDEHTEEDPS